MSTTRRTLAASFSTTGSRIIIILALLWTAAAFWYRHASSHDPTSFFFRSHDDDRAVYSRQRLLEADAYINRSQEQPLSSTKPVQKPEVCVGIATVRRRQTQYIRYTIGSLLNDLINDERNKIFLAVLVAHTDPGKHPIYSESWLANTADKIIEYDQDGSDFDMVKNWEDNAQYRNKTIYDYMLVLQECYLSEAPYILMIEDDVLACAGWFKQMLASLEEIELTLNRRIQNEWIYLRLFFADGLLGWNSEYWPWYLSWSALIWAVAACVTVSAKTYWRHGSQVLSRTATVFFICCFIPASILLYFMAGKLTMWPLFPGVHEMNRYGCCSQALVFPRSIVPILMDHSDFTIDWLVDMMIEQLADRLNLTRWVTVPALFQHVGAISSKGVGFDKDATKLWNYGFEQHQGR